MREFYIHTKDYALAKWRYNPKKMIWEAEIFHARPGSSINEAWQNAIDAARGISKKEFIDAGWRVQKLIVTGNTEGK